MAIVVGEIQAIIKANNDSFKKTIRETQSIAASASSNISKSFDNTSKSISNSAKTASQSMSLSFGTITKGLAAIGALQIGKRLFEDAIKGSDLLKSKVEALRKPITDIFGKSLEIIIKIPAVDMLFDSVVTGLNNVSNFLSDIQSKGLLKASISSPATAGTLGLLGAGAVAGGSTALANYATPKIQERFSKAYKGIFVEFIKGIGDEYRDAKKAKESILSKYEDFKESRVKLETGIKVGLRDVSSMVANLPKKRMGFSEGKSNEEKLAKKAISDRLTQVNAFKFGWEGLMRDGDEIEKEVDKANYAFDKVQARVDEHKRLTKSLFYKTTIAIKAWAKDFATLIAQGVRSSDNVVASLLNWKLPILTPLFSSISSGISLMFTGISNLGSRIATSIGGAAISTYVSIASMGTFNTVWAAFTTSFGATMTAIRTGFAKMIASVTGAVTAITTFIATSGGLTGVFTLGLAKLAGFWTTITTLLQTSVGGIASAIAVLALLTTSFMTLMKSFELYKEANESAGQNASLMDDIALALDEWTGGIFNVTGILEKVSGAFDFMFEAFDNMLSGLAESYNGMIDNISDILVHFYDPEALRKMQRVEAPQFISKSRKEARDKRAARDKRLSGSENFGAGFEDMDVSLGLDAKVKALKASIKSWFSPQANFQDLFNFISEKIKKVKSEVDANFGDFDFAMGFNQPKFSFEEVIKQYQKLINLKPEDQFGMGFEDFDKALGVGVNKVDERFAPTAMKGSVEAYKILNARDPVEEKQLKTLNGVFGVLQEMNNTGIKLSGVAIAN